MSVRLDKTKPLKEQFKVLAVEAGLEEPETPITTALPAPANDDKTDCCVDDKPTPDDIWKHKLGEAVLPLRFLNKFLDLFPGSRAHSVSQIVDAQGEVRDNVRHVVVYDTYENLRRYESK